jgi:hypothetical protein
MALVEVYFTGLKGREGLYHARYPAQLIDKCGNRVKVFLEKWHTDKNIIWIHQSRLHSRLISRQPNKCFQKGDSVYALWTDKAQNVPDVGIWYKARVKHTNEDGSVYIKWIGWPGYANVKVSQLRLARK